MTIAGAVTEVARSLQGAPAFLTVAIVNIALLGMLFVAMHQSNVRRDKQFNYVLHRCTELAPPKGIE
jgi:hypothetical protein